MIVTMDAAGRVVLPKAVRDRARLSPGVPIEVRVVDGRIELEPACTRVNVEKRGGVWVAAPIEPLPPLTRSEVELALDAVRSHGGDASGDD
jgi:AbrB family looped-hinge helix DNA binding protein